MNVYELCKIKSLVFIRFLLLWWSTVCRLLGFINRSISFIILRDSRRTQPFIVKNGGRTVEMLKIKLLKS